MKRFRWVMKSLVSLGLVLAALTNILWAKNEKGKKGEVAPTVSITSPQDGAKVGGDTLNVVVSFSARERIETPSRQAREGTRGNVRTIKLKLDGKLVATHDNPAQIKEGTHTFKLDITNLPDGDHTLQAFAYQAEERAMLEGSSEIITFTFISVSKQIAKMEEAFTAGSWEDLTQAAATLMEMGKPAVPYLLTAFKDSGKNEVLRKMYAEIIGEIKDGSAVGPLVEVLNNPNETEFIRAEAASTLGKIGVETAFNPLLNTLNDPSEQVRSMAAYGLGYLGSGNAVVPLIGKLTDPSELMRNRVIRALGALPDSRAVEPLINCLEDPSESVVTQAILSLGALKDSRAIVPLIDILETKTGIRQVSAMQALGQLGDTRAVDPLISILQGQNEYLMIHAGLALAKIGDQGAVDPLRTAIERVKDEFVKQKLKEAYKILTGEEYQE